MKKHMIISDDILVGLMQNLNNCIANELKAILAGKDNVTVLRELLIDAVEDLGDFPILKFVPLDGPKLELIG